MGSVSIPEAMVGSEEMNGGCLLNQMV